VRRCDAPAYFLRVRRPAAGRRAVDLKLKEEHHRTGRVAGAPAPRDGPGGLDPEEETRMPQFMDVHKSMRGVTSEQLAAAHQADLDIQGEEGVDFKQAWADPNTGHVFCLSEAPDAEAVQRVHERAGHRADEVHEITVTA